MSKENKLQEELINSTTITLLGRKGLGKTVGSAILINNVDKHSVILDITGAYSTGQLIREALYLKIDTRIDRSIIVKILEQFENYKRIVIDLSNQTRKELVEFSELFFKTINQVGDIAVVVDEVGEIVSQQKEYYSPEFERCVRIGRNYGIKPVIMITQRTQKADKNVLALSDYYVVMGLTHNLDLKAVQELVGLDSESFEPLKKSIKNLGVGKCEVVKFSGETEKAVFDMVNNEISKVEPFNKRQQKILKDLESDK